MAGPCQRISLRSRGGTGLPRSPPVLLCAQVQNLLLGFGRYAPLGGKRLGRGVPDCRILIGQRDLHCCFLLDTVTVHVDSFENPLR